MDAAVARRGIELEVDARAAELLGVRRTRAEQASRHREGGEGQAEQIRLHGTFLLAARHGAEAGVRGISPGWREPERSSGAADAQGSRAVTPGGP